MYTVYFKKSQKKRKIIGKSQTQDGAFQIISNFLKSIEFDCYYYNMYINDDGELVVDYGSHTDFCYIKGDEKCKIELGM